jgi:hypothetical protein
MLNSAADVPVFSRLASVGPVVTLAGIRLAVCPLREHPSSVGLFSFGENASFLLRERPNMKRSRWLERFRTVFCRASRSRAKLSGPRRVRSRKAAFEPLEDRLAFALLVELAPAPVADVATVSPGPQLGEYELTTSTAVPANLARSWLASFSGQRTYQAAGSGVSVQSDDFFAIIPDRTYALSGWAKSGDEFERRFEAANRQSLSLISYDHDLRPILPQHVLRFAGAVDTTLAAPLNLGDTSIHLTSAAGWSNAAEASARTRGLAWYHYWNDGGYVYADYTYTRNVALGGEEGLWKAGAISGNTISLSEPWNGPTIPAGAAVRNTGDGRDEMHLLPVASAVL